MLNLVMVLHCHQPLGNFDHVFKTALEKCYGPVLDLLESHPDVKVGLHLSGPLLEWMEKNRPSVIELVKSMVERKQVEPLSGGFFEPLLASIPVRDAKGQVLKMNDYINRRFKYKATGFWLTERVWDPALPLILEGTAMSYTIVDDTHFYYAGLTDSQMYGSYLTEKEGHTLSLLATPMIMRYLIPFRFVEDVITYLKSQANMGRTLAMYGDDCEKFGLWPGTHEWVIKKGWLEEFFKAIEDNRDWLKTTLPGEFLETNPPLGRIYPPQASYEEMTGWALPPAQTHMLEEIIADLKKEGRWDRWRPFVRGGIWDNFLVKYDESNRMHKKMLFLSKKMADHEQARESLWRAQCNCAYWHGVFGGLYLGHLRRSVHENLVKAQSSIMADSGKEIVLFKEDIDKDGYKEILVWNHEMALGISPKRGGGIFELCHFPTALTLTDVLTRRPEAYHYELTNITQTEVTEEKHKEGIPSIHEVSHSGGDLSKLVFYDTYDKISLLDHFLGQAATLQGYAVNDYPEDGDFAQAEYTLKEDKVTSNSAFIRLSKKGNVGPAALLVDKSIMVKSEAGATLDYYFKNTGSQPVSTTYGCEFNMNLYSDQDPQRYYLCKESGAVRKVSETGAEDNLTGFELVNEPDNLRLIFLFSRPVSCWFYPIMTVSKSEQGFEYAYQGTSLLFLFPLQLEPDKKEQFQIKLELKIRKPSRK
jgi:hypothetical protein